MPRPQRFLVRGAFFAGVWQPPPCPPQQRVFAPRFTEYRDTARPEHAEQFPSRDGHVKVVQDGVAPDAVERPIGEGQAGSVRLKEADGDAVGLSTFPGLAEIARRDIKR